jgi:hypothetical protein
MVYAFAPDDEPGPVANQPGTPAKIPGATTPPPKFDDGTSVPYEMGFTDLAARCPFCAKELESADAIICLHCGYNRQSRSRAQTQRTIANTQGDKFIWRLPGILCIIGCLLCIGLIVYLWVFLSSSQSSPDRVTSAEEEERTWWFAVQVWGTIFSLFAIWFMGRFAFLRLVRSPTPPEVVKQ